MPFDPAFTSSYIVAFAMGLASSLHCIGMCGSIIGTLTLSLSPNVRGSNYLLSAFVLNYNLGRLTSYMLAGGFVGIIQTITVMPFGEHGYRIIQILSAIIMASSGLYIAGWFSMFAYVEKVGLILWKKLEPYGRRLIPVSNRLQAYLFGVVWGWLPCGLVYTALVLAATAGSAEKSAFTMLAFGLGTLPAVMSVGVMNGVLTRLSRMKQFRKAIGLFMITLALMAAMPWLNPMVINTHADMHVTNH